MFSTCRKFDDTLRQNLASWPNHKEYRIFIPLKIAEHPQRTFAYAIAIVSQSQS